MRSHPFGADSCVKMPQFCLLISGVRKETPKKEVSVPAAVEKINRGPFKIIIVDLLVCLGLAD